MVCTQTYTDCCKHLLSPCSAPSIPITYWQYDDLETILFFFFCTAPLHFHEQTAKTTHQSAAGRSICRGIRLWDIQRVPFHPLIAVWVPHWIFRVCLFFLPLCIFYFSWSAHPSSIPCPMPLTFHSIKHLSTN